MKINKNQMKIVITGAAGFLGSHLVERLKEDERYFVYALSSRGEELQRLSTYANVEYCSKSVIFSDNENKILNDSVIINCAFPRASTGAGMADGLRYIQNLFDRAFSSSAKAIVNISSQSVYSALRDVAATEMTPICLETPYAVGKYATELILESSCKETGIPYTNIRMASLIGPEFDQRIVNRLITNALQGKDLHITRSERRFGFLDVEDAVGAIISLLKTAPEIWKSVYNVGNAKEYSVEEIVQNIKKVFKEKCQKFPDIFFENKEEKGNSSVDYHLFHNDTGFEPMIELCESISKIMEKELLNQK